jgi:hypothetical protein
MACGICRHSLIGEGQADGATPRGRLPGFKAPITCGSNQPCLHEQPCMRAQPLLLACRGRVFLHAFSARVLMNLLTCQRGNQRVHHAQQRAQSNQSRQSSPKYAASRIHPLLQVHFGSTVQVQQMYSHPRGTLTGTS